MKEKQLTLAEIRAIQYIMEKVYKACCINNCVVCFCREGCPSWAAEGAKDTIEYRKAYGSKEDKKYKDTGWKEIVKTIIND